MYCIIVLHDSHKEAPRHNVRKRKCGVCLPQYVWSAFFVAYVLKRVFFFLSFGHCLSIMSPFFCVRFLRNVFCCTVRLWWWLGGALLYNLNGLTSLTRTILCEDD